MFLSLSGTLTSSVNSLASLVPSAISLTISAGRLMDIVEMPQEDYSQDDAVNTFEKKYRSEGFGLSMEHLNYTYRSGTHVFADASLEAYPHEIVALVGPSGEGKTTMLRLILPFCMRKAAPSISVPGKIMKNRFLCHRPPESCSPTYLRETPCSPAPLQKICEM